VIGPDRQLAWHMLGAVLRAVRDRLPVELAAHLGAQLPLIVRGAHYDQYQRSLQPAEIDTLDAFCARINAKMQFARPIDPADALRAVLATLSQHIAPEVIAREIRPPQVRGTDQARPFDPRSPLRHHDGRVMLVWTNTRMP
jgi:uncharacterized protein (DUF2267 family)